MTDTELVVYEYPMVANIMSSIGLPQEFKVIGPTELAFIAENMPDVYRNKEIYGRKNSQVMGKAMTLTMLRHGPYNAIHQCDAQIDAKRSAVKENTFKLAKLKNKIAEMEEKLLTEQDTYKTKNMELDIIKKRMDLADARVHVEHALREILMYMETKKQIKKAHNIPDNFDERDWTAAEIKEHIQTAFQHTLRDILMSGRINVGTCEYVEQFGITPMAAVAEVAQFLENCNPEDVNDLYAWYDRMYDKYKGEFDKAMKRLGVEDVVTEGAAYFEED